MEEKKVEEKKAEAKPKKEESERAENIAALSIFFGIIIIIAAVLTDGFGLFAKSVDENQRINVQLGNDAFRGNASAPVIIIAFSDYQCPFCKKAELTIRSIIEKNPNNIVFVFKDYPLTEIHKNAMNAALAAECAKEQGKYWEYHDLLFDNNGQLDVESLKLYAISLNLSSDDFNKCLDSEKYKHEITSDVSAGMNAGVSSTPTFFIKGIKIVGAQPEEEFTKIINSEIESGPRT